jgi:phage terminase large subunit
MGPDAAVLKRWRESPPLMVREFFGATPDPWQDDALAAKEPRLAMKASKGPGKTTVLAWRAWNFLMTHEDCNIAATSVSADNLRDNLWKEMAIWRNKAPWLQERFEWQTERIFAREAPATWFMSARSWAKSATAEAIGNTLAGLHSDYIMFLIDESGSIPTAITMSAEAALSSCKEGYVIQAGNTNSLDGALYDACVTRKHLWRVIPITGDPDDPKRSSRVSLEWAREMVATYGRDNPHVKVMVLGEWPAASINALLGPEDIEAAQKRRYQQHDIDHAPKLLGVDVARFGDDASVIFPRQGLVAFKPKILRNVTGVEGGGHVARTKADWGTDAIFIDNTGGFGSAWIDVLTTLNVATIPVDFSGAARDPRYFNRRAEMHFLAAEWIKHGGALPDDPELVAEATQTTYTFKGDRLIMEPKALVKVKIGRSPDRWDAFVTTFAEPVAGKVKAVATAQREDRYDPFGEMLRAG